MPFIGTKDPFHCSEEEAQERLSIAEAHLGKTKYRGPWC